MANKQISQLPAALTMQDSDLLVCEQNGVAKRLTGSILMAMINSHGGITGSSYTPPVAPSLQGTLTLTFTDGTSFNVPIMNGAKGDTGARGEQGERGAAFTYEDFTPEQLESLRGEQGIQGVPGNPGYVHIKWSSVEPTSDADMGDIPDAWMGIYSGSSSTAPTAYTAYAWYKIKGEHGADGEQGLSGERGTFIWLSSNEAIFDGSLYWILSSYLNNPSEDPGEHPRRGDFVFYGDRYYTFTDLVINNKYNVTAPTMINSAALPSGGDTGYVLAKASNVDFDVEWVQGGGAQGIFWCTDSTTGTQISEALQLGKLPIKEDSSGRYLVFLKQSGSNYIFAAVDGANVEKEVRELAGWTHEILPLYSKPYGGIPSTDLASAVQTSLGKADTALQSVPNTYRTAAAQDTIDAGKEDKTTEVTVSTAGAVTQALDAGKWYHFTGALTALTITFNAPAAGQLAQYHFDFDEPSTAFDPTLPSGVKLPDNHTWEASKHCEVDILNNYAVVMTWAAS